MNQKVEKNELKWFKLC